MKDINQQVVTDGLQQKGVIKKDEYVEGVQLQRAVEDKNVIIRDQNDFNTIS